MEIELCPETGICSIVRGEGAKVDLMPDEVEAVREAAGDPRRMREIIGESDAGFAVALTPAELEQIGRRLG